MNELIQTFTNLLSGENMARFSEIIGAGQVTSERVVTAGVTALIGALADRVKQVGGAAALEKTIQSPEAQAAGIADGSILDDVGPFLQNPTAAHGLSLLQGFLGGQYPALEKKIADAARVDQGVAGRLIPVLAPLVLGFLGRQAAARGLDAAGLGKFVTDQQGYLRASAPGLLGFLERIDANDDGSVADDLGRLFGRLTGRAR